jgi:hypothetical protein
MIVDQADVCRARLRESSGDSGELAHHDPGGLIVVTFVPPEAAFDPPAVFPLIVEQNAAPAADLVFELYLRVLLHTHLDCAGGFVVPGKKRASWPYFGSKSSETPFMQ